MTVADHQMVGDVGFAAWLSSSQGEAEFGDRDVVEAARKAFLDYPASAKGHVAVAEIAGRLAGWGACEDAPDYISDLWIDPAYQGRGVGSALLRHFLTRIATAGFKVAKIDTRATNAGAIRLYERNGFSIVWRGVERDLSLGIDLDKVKLEKHLG
ncbi:GNAT family N-acetyltransferase [Rhizobium sp. P32RR-XVIII]|nr:GNAT family N-acetyltransferase [Rhizobium sp. P32RR-XVIII]NLS03234.1 GNAT family N-acetyltransferase [Rhizobium sp. P32RR-XVIII]